MSKKIALVTMVFGESYKKNFYRYSYDGFLIYCKKYNYDLVVIEDLLDKSELALSRSPAWQKLLILNQDWSQKYEQIIWIDSDIVINISKAESIAKAVPDHMIGAVEAYSIPDRYSHHAALKALYLKWDDEGVSYIKNLTVSEYYKNREIECNLSELMQTGVFVCSPKYHKDLFEYIYNTYDGNTDPSWNYEMPYMSYELLKRDLVIWLDPKFNYLVNDVMMARYGNNSKFNLMEKIFDNFGFLYFKRGLTSNLKSIYSDGYFIHFAGCQNLMKYSR